MEQSIRYLHAAAGYPPEETWTDAINAGKYNTWPGLTATAVRRHFPELDETQKGHMKKQRQNVRSAKIKVENNSTRESHPPERRRCMTSTSKYIMSATQCTATKLDAFQQH